MLITQTDTNRPSSHHSSMFGRKAMLPIEIDVEKKDVDQKIEPFSTELSSSVLEAVTNRRQQLLGEAKENILKPQKHQKEDYDKRRL